MTIIREFVGGAAAINKKIFRAFETVDRSLVFFNRAEKKDNRVVHEGERLTSFPV